LSIPFEKRNYSRPNIR